MTLCTLPLELSVQIAFHHGLRQTFAATELSRSLHIGDIQFVKWFCLVISVIEENGIFTIVREVHLAPRFDSEVIFVRSVIGMNTFLAFIAELRIVTMFDPPLCSVLFRHCHEPHSEFNKMREEFCHFCFGSKLDTTWNGWRLSKFFEVFLNRHILAEMKEAFEFVAIKIPHSVEIACCKPVGVENLFRFWATNCVQKETFELIVRNAIFCAGTDIIVILPEFFRHTWSAYSLQKSAAIFDSCPFQDATNGHVEHNRVIVFENSRIENSRLAE